MGVTATWGIPFAEVFDPPHGPDQEEALAEATDAALTIVADAASAADAKAVRNGWRSFSSRLAANQAIGAMADIPTLAPIAFTTANANTDILVSMSIRPDTPGNQYMIVRLVVDGVNHPAELPGGSNGLLVPPVFSLADLKIPLAASGPHTLKLQAAGSGGGSLQGFVTGFTVKVLGP
jgi:hypothetical protein